MPTYRTRLRGMQRTAGPALALALGSCGPSATEGGFDSPNPAAKMYAIEAAARAGDRSALKSIVEQLDSDDPAVRALAIATLKRLTGETLGYRDFDPAEEREAAIGRWKKAVESGRFDTQPAAEPADQPTIANHG